MSNENNTASTQSDDAGFNAGQDYQNFDDIPVPMGPMGVALGLEEESLPEDDESNLDPEDSMDEDVPEDEDTIDEDDTDDDVEDASDDDEYDDDSDEDSTEEDELLAEDEIDWDYKVPVKVDGEIQHVSLAELRKGFATDQHLSKKGREVSELEKELKSEYEKNISEVVELGQTLAVQLSADEQTLAQQYHEIEANIEKARDEGDTYEVNELKDKRETIQKKYWEARNKREGLAEVIQKQQEEQLQQQVEVLMEQFNKEIVDLVPDFEPEPIREFALSEGIPEELLDTIMDAKVVKFIDDYRKLKQKTSSGSAKRKKAPKAKGVPTKRGSTSKRVREGKQKGALRDTVLSGEADEASQLDFLKSLSKFR
jgi:hypothetical protein